MRGLNSASNGDFQAGRETSITVTKMDHTNRATRRGFRQTIITETAL
jgi:hypothetical protein